MATNSHRHGSWSRFHFFHSSIIQCPLHVLPKTPNFPQAGAKAILLQIPKERPVFLREYLNNQYSAATYILSKLLVETPILAAQCIILVALLHFGYGLSGSFWLLWLVFFLAMHCGAAGAVMISTAWTDAPEVVGSNSSLRNYTAEVQHSHLRTNASQ